MLCFLDDGDGMDPGNEFLRIIYVIQKQTKVHALKVCNMNTTK